MPRRKNKSGTHPHHTDFAFVKKVGDVFEYQLQSNSLRILIYPKHDASGIVGTMVTYHVGSRHEVSGYTGATHLLEHLLFKESKHFNEKDKNTILDVLEKRGAEVNASTSFDRTDYYCLLPLHLLDTGLAIEADRMRNAYIKQVHKDSEMPVVRNELEWRDNNSYASLYYAMHSTAFQSHPYHHPVIGWRSDVESITIDRLQWFYDQYYYPNNATLSLVGDISVRDALDAVSHHFSSVRPKSAPFEKPRTEEEPQRGERHITIRRSGENLVGCVYKIPEALHADIAPLRVLSIVLAGIRSSRLDKVFVDTAKATRVEAGVNDFREAGLFDIFITLTDARTHENALALLDQCIAEIKRKGITKKELNMAKKLIERARALKTDSVSGILDSISEDISRGDWTRYYWLSDSLMKVTQADVKRVATTYFTHDRRTTGFYVKP